MKKMQNKTQTHSSPKQRRDDESPRTARSSQLPRLLALSFMLCRCFLPMRTLYLSLLSLFLSLFLSVFSSSFAFFAPSSFFTFFSNDILSLFPAKLRASSPHRPAAHGPKHTRYGSFSRRSTTTTTTSLLLLPLLLLLLLLLLAHSHRHSRRAARP